MVLARGFVRLEAGERLARARRDCRDRRGRRRGGGRIKPELRTLFGNRFPGRSLPGRQVRCAMPGMCSSSSGLCRRTLQAQAVCCPRGL